MLRAYCLNVYVLCHQVPSFYRKHKSKAGDVRRHHKDFFETVISCEVEVSLEDAPDAPDASDAPNVPDAPDPE